MEISQEWIEQLRKDIRTKSGDADKEVQDLAEACIKDLEIAGVYVTDETDPLTRQAVKLYCKGNYGYDENTERFREAYAALKDAMALCGDYGRDAGE